MQRCCLHRRLFPQSLTITSYFFAKYNALKGKKQSKESVEKRAKTLQKSIGKKVNQFTLDGSFIRSFNSFNEAARITGIWEASIRNCRIGKNHPAGGYIWKFPRSNF